VLSPSQPYFYLLAYIVVLYVRPQEFVPAFEGVPIVPVLLSFAALFWLIAQKKDFEASQHRLLPALAGTMFVSVLLTGWLMGAVGAVVEFAPTMILFYVVATSVDSVRKFREMCLVLTAACCVLALHGVDQAANPDGVGWTGAKMIQGRITYVGFLNDPNDLSMAFVMALPFTMYLAGTATSLVTRHVYHAAAALLLYGIYLCNSRGSLLALGGMLFVYSVRRYGWTRSLVVAPMLALPLILLAPSRVSEMSADEESAAGRVDAWYEGFQMLRGKPLFGVGKGFFTEYNELTAHNSFVLSFAETGVVGYFFWLSMIVLSAIMLRQILSHEAPPPSVPPVPSPPPAAAQADLEWADWKRMAETLLYAFVGTMLASFFLSRTYIAIIYLTVALIVATHQGIRRRWPALAPVLVSGRVWFLVKIELASIVGLWLLTRILLNT
jgi:putative inorganic carbon (hco3(-)) transporter